MIEDAVRLAARLGPERVALENVPWATDLGTPFAAILPQTIRRVIEASNCRLLLDLAHVRLAAHDLDMDPRDYIGQLPTDRLLEVHVSGVLVQPDGTWVDHHPMTEADWDLLRWALENIARGEWARPWVLSFEYGGVGKPFAYRSDAAVLAKQLPRLDEMVQGAR
jgi:hypothetical protein